MGLELHYDESVKCWIRVYIHSDEIIMEYFSVIRYDYDEMI